jgi:hypothetical protein
MRSASRMGLRVAGLLAMAVFVAHCGDSNVHINTGGVNPSAGSFTGTTGEGGDITILVGSIEAITLECDGETLVENFSPPEPINSDGTFNVTITDRGKRVHVSGTFTSSNSVEGVINDEDNDCDTTFSASRTGVVATSTPSDGKTRTPTPVGTEPTPTTAETATPAETSTAGTPEGTSTGPTPTGATPTTATTATPGGSACPTKLTIEGQGEQADLDTGTSGLAFDQKVIGKGTVSVTLACPGAAPPSCGSCAVTGPIASTTTTNNARCTTDSHIACTCTGSGKTGDPVTCTPQTPCPGSGTCQFFFGAPLPLSSGGIGVCVVNQVVGSITGTANPDTGSGESQVKIASHVHLALDNFKPCPRCLSGTCNEGARQGMACTVHGTSSDFGDTSFDCPPGGSDVSGANGLQINLNPTTGTTTLQPDAGANKCVFQAFNGKACYCPLQRVPNDCDDSICPADATGEGTCTSPTDLFCASEPFRPCLSNADCPSSDCTLLKPRKCSGLTDQTLNIIGPLTRTGTANKTNPVLVSTFCIAAVASAAVNNAAGLPGPGALKLPSKSCFGDSCTF